MRFLRNYFLARIVSSALLLSLAQPCVADEGLWLFNQFPYELLEKQHGVRLSPAWLDHLRLSTVSLSMGGGFTASAFVSSKGLVAASHSPLKACIARVQRPGEDLLARGFYADDAEEERRCPGAEAQVLVSMEDVTASIQSSGGTAKSAADSATALSRSIAAVEAACSSGSYRCKVISLYSGARFHLYKYRLYRDVRLVFAPEESTSFYGGQAANFNFPRLSMQTTFVRVWEDDEKPAHIEHYLRWSASGPLDGDLLVQAADARTTDRARPLSFLRVDRDVMFPLEIVVLEEFIRTLGSAELMDDSQVQVMLFQAKNSRKSRQGRLDALRSPHVLKLKSASERRGNRLLQLKQGAKTAAPPLVKAVDRAAGDYRRIASEYWLLAASTVTGPMFNSARRLSRLANETAKADSERLPEFQEGRLPALRQMLLTPNPVNKRREVAYLDAYLTAIQRVLGSNHPVCKSLFSKSSPSSVAAAAIEQSKLDDVQTRRKWLEDLHNPELFQDPLVRISSVLDVYARRARTIYERADAIQRDYAAAVAEAELESRSSRVYPEATGTLRVTWGKAIGFDKVPYATRLGEWFVASTADGNGNLPPRFVEAQSGLNPAATINFATTVDVANGHSGPTVDRHGNLVGMLFDSNYLHIGNAYVYLDEGSRAIHMSTAGALELLQKVYRASRIVEELQADAPSAP